MVALVDRKLTPCTSRRAVILTCRMGSCDLPQTSVNAATENANSSTTELLKEKAAAKVWPPSHFCLLDPSSAPRAGESGKGGVWLSRHYHAGRYVRREVGGHGGADLPNPSQRVLILSSDKEPRKMSLCLQPSFTAYTPLHAPHTWTIPCQGNPLSQGNYKFQLGKGLAQMRSVNEKNKKQ